MWIFHTLHFYFGIIHFNNPITMNPSKMVGLTTIMLLVVLSINLFAFKTIKVQNEPPVMISEVIERDTTGIMDGVFAVPELP